MTILLLNRALRRSTKALRLVFAAEDTSIDSTTRPMFPWPWLKRAARILVLALLFVHLWYIGTTSLLIACFAKVDPAATTLAMYRKHVDGWKVHKPLPTRLENIPIRARRMLVSVEDYKFWEHHGVDIEAFSRALEINKQIGKPMYGGSTLTMQTARTLFLIPAKSYMRKYLELIVAFELELLLSKERILELYFSWAEWGKGVFGIEAASMLYYGVPLAKLGASNTARLMAVLSSPIRYTPFTLTQSKLLASRYEFLVKRYVP